MNKNEEIDKKIGNFWSGFNKNERPYPIFWWESKLVRRHINKVVAGVDNLDKGCEGTYLLLSERLKNQRLKVAVSVGCGLASKEMRLIKDGLVESFILYELSDDRISEGMRQAKKLGLEDKVEFRKGDFYSEIDKMSVDMVHWNNSLHHMFDVKKAVSWSYEVLKNGGCFFMDDFVGANRFQWPEENLKMASLVRRMLPKKYLKNPHKSSSLEYVNDTISRPNLEKLIAADPSEAVDSDRILDSVKTYFPNANIILTGGAVYQLALKDIIFNFDENNEVDKALLELILKIDELATKAGEITSHYAATIATK